MSEQATPVTPGQAAYEAMHKSRIARDDDDSGFIAWDELDETWDDDIGEGLHREDMEAAAKAATAAHALSGTGALMGDIIALRDERDSLTERVAGLVTEGNELRSLVAEIIAQFSTASGGWYLGGVSREQYGSWCKRGGITPAVVTAGTEHLAAQIRDLAIGGEDQP